MFTNVNIPLQLETGSCTSCGREDGQTLYRVRDHLYGVDGREFRLARCHGCGLVFLSPRPTREALPDAYPAEYFWNGFDLKEGRSLTEQAWNIWALNLVRRRVGFVQKVATLAPSARVLEVGCGRGLFLRELQARTRAEVHGVELQERNVEHLRQFESLHAHHADFLSWEAGELRFAAIAMWHVLEHMHDPASALRKAFSLLSPGGVLLVGTQNYDALSRLLMGDRWTLNDVPRHLYHFTEASIGRLASDAGFRVERVWHFSELFPVLGSHLFSEFLLDRQRAVRPWPALALNLLFSPLEALAALLQRGCVMTLALRKS